VGVVHRAQAPSFCSIDRGTIYGGQADSLEFRRDGGFHGRHFGSGVGGFGGLVEAGAVMVVTVSLEVGDWVAWVTFAI